jgi:hypothetical protein
METGLHGDDLRNAQNRSSIVSSRPSLEDILTHQIPREAQHRRTNSELPASHNPLHIAYATATCQHVSCKSSVQMESISTHWPLFLRINPLWQTRGPGECAEIQDAQCSASFSLGAVEYKLVGRVLYMGDSNPMGSSTGHFITHTRVGDHAYMYNDLQRDGSLAHLGPLYVLEDNHLGTVYLLYIRTTLASVCIAMFFTTQITPHDESHVSFHRKQHALYLR